MDAGLIRKLKSGDEEAFKKVFEKYYRPMCLYAESFLKDSDAAKDIVEEVFVNVWLRISEIEIDKNFKHYLFRSVHNNCIKHLKKRKKRARLFGEYIFEDHEILNYASDDYPFAKLIVEEIEKKAELSIKNLPDQCRKIFELCRYENLSYPQIARKLDISLSTVKTQMSRAMEKLRKDLGEYFYLIFILLWP